MQKCIDLYKLVTPHFSRKISDLAHCAVYQMSMTTGTPFLFKTYKERVYQMSMTSGTPFLLKTYKEKVYQMRMTTGTPSDYY